METLLRVLAVGATLCLQLSTTSAQGTTYTVLVITNPAPAAGDWFGLPVAAVGTDRVLIGSSYDDLVAPYAHDGAAYLYSTSGALLTIFTNPTPGSAEFFGATVAALGADRVLIGAHDDSTGANYTGAAYLFGTNGALLTTFTNPTPAFAELFGSSVATVGSDRVLIGAYSAYSGALRTGAAYLFTTNGALLTTLTNPTPADAGYFGSSVAAVGNDRVLIGAQQDDTGAADAGAAYLFSTNGQLLTTFTNPTPAAADYFGSSVAAVGLDRVLIGAHRDDSGIIDVGAAYLFSTSGVLLNTFTNPTPAAGDGFGGALAAVGSERVLIGASRDDTGATNAGAAYLFSSNGALLTTFTNPTPAASDYFGSSVAAAANGRLLIGAYGKYGGASGGVGEAYLFTPRSPALTIGLTVSNTVAVSWPFPSSNWVLQENTNDITSPNWSNVSGPIRDDVTNKTFIVNPPNGKRYYRLSSP